MQTFLVVVILALAVCYLGRRLRRTLSGKGGCCGCSGCASRKSAFAPIACSPSCGLASERGSCGRNGRSA
jgi:hypothetical protein